MTLSIDSFEEYQTIYESSIKNPEAWWDTVAKELVTWHRPYDTVYYGTILTGLRAAYSDFKTGENSWFLNGQLNVCYNCVDRHAMKDPHKIAIIHEGDEPNATTPISYSTLLKNVCQVSNYLLSLGLKKGDTVTIYMPMIPEAVFAMLACARLGLVHSVVFAGFSAEALHDRIVDAGSKLLITVDQSKRGGRIFDMKKIADLAIHDTTVTTVLMFKNTHGEVPFTAEKDVCWNEVVPLQRPYCPPVWVEAEDPFFMLYTSGSTGKPKGILHSTAGYLVYTAYTMKTVFKYQDGDIFGCMADIGWITGHSYIVYGSLCNGATTVMFEGVPTYPTPSRYWELVDRLKITQLYLSPTVIRTLQKLGSKHLEGYELTSLKVLGSVGEPINPEAWNWYHKYVGHGKCDIVDTYWQTETGGIVISPIAGVTKTKPGSATFPLPGIGVAIVDQHTGKLLEGNNVTGVLVITTPWPSMARTIRHDHIRYLNAYFNPYFGYYSTGDSAHRDEDGYIWIRGRIDDVINVSGHRLSTAEIESAVCRHPNVAEAAAFGQHDDITGQSICVFCVPKENGLSNDHTKTEIVQLVRSAIGPIATPKRVLLIPDLPKTRSGKIMRRILRKIIAGEYAPDQLGDLSTLNNPSLVQVLIDTIVQTN